MLIRRLGRADYQATWDAMRAFTDARTPATEDELWVCEHAPVFTQGIAGKEEHLLLNPTGIPVVKTDRGGQITYHGPGQTMVYVLLDLRRAGYGVRELVQRIERGVIAMLASHGVTAYGKTRCAGRLCASRQQPAGSQDRLARAQGAQWLHLSRRRLQRGDGPGAVRRASIPAVTAGLRSPIWLRSRPPRPTTTRCQWRWPGRYSSRWQRAQLFHEKAVCSGLEKRFARMSTLFGFLLPSPDKWALTKKVDLSVARHSTVRKSRHGLAANSRQH